MDFSSLVLMEKDKETGFITKELGSMLNFVLLVLSLSFIVE